MPEIARVDTINDEVEFTDGTKAMLKKYPEYRLDVYQTHRTAAAPQWVYDNTFKNATRAKTIEGGFGMEGAFGGAPKSLGNPDGTLSVTMDVVK